MTGKDAARDPRQVPGRNNNALDPLRLAREGTPAPERERAARRAHTEARRVDERRRASRELDRILAMCEAWRDDWREGYAEGFAEGWVARERERGGLDEHEDDDELGEAS